MFDSFNLPLYHGWVCDVQDTSTYAVVGHRSYNQCVFRLVEWREWQQQQQQRRKEGAGIGAVLGDEDGEDRGDDDGDDEEEEEAEEEEEEEEEDVYLATDGPVIDAFFSSTAAQLTYYGLLLLHAQVKERQLGVFFRNNHFSTLFKLDGRLYLLATDAGFVDTGVVWELLDEIDGDTEYCGEDFTGATGSSGGGGDMSGVGISAHCLPPSIFDTGHGTVAAPAPTPMPTCTPPLPPTPDDEDADLQAALALARSFEYEDTQARARSGVAHGAHLSERERNARELDLRLQRATADNAPPAGMSGISSSGSGSSGGDRTRPTPTGGPMPIPIGQPTSSAGARSRLDKTGYFAGKKKVACILLSSPRWYMPLPCLLSGNFAA